MEKIIWKRVLLLFFVLQFCLPALVAIDAHLLDNAKFLEVLREAFKITFIFLCLVFYIPLSFKVLKDWIYVKPPTEK